MDSLGGDVDARLIATAIAAYDEGSLYREEYGLYPRPCSVRLVGLVMRGSWPTLFRIDLPNQIRNKVLGPEFDIVINQENLRVGTATVRAYQPVVPWPQQRVKEGMKSLDNRKFLVDKFLRLKQLMLRISGKRE